MESESRDYQHQAEVCTGTHQSDYTFKEEHVPGLAEALAEVAYKWEQIAVALRLPKTVIEECREKGKDLAMKLYQILHTWVVGQYSNAALATKENLKRALAGPLVQHPQLASELEDKLKTSLSSHILTASQKESIFQSIFQSGVREVLVEKYSQCQEVPCGSWPPVVSKTFINLALIETSGQPLKSDYSIRGDADDVLAMKKIVEYEDMFSVYEMRKKLLILGRPGSGKTTLVHKLVRDWSAGKALQGAELVFLVSLRVLGSDKCGLAQLLQKHIYSEEDLKLVINAIERARGKGVCFIFDGFDEYCPRNKEKSVIFALFDKSYLVDAMIIVTSRPAAASAVTEIFNDSYRKIEVFGFSKSQIMEYVRLFPFSSSSSGNEAHAKKLQSFLSSHPGVLDLCYLPVNCAIICFIYDTEPDYLPDTQTQIYALFTRLLIIRQLTSRIKFRQLDSLEDLEGQEAEDFKKLCSLAFDMTTHSQQVITRGPASSDEAHSLGLVTTDITAGLSGYKNSYSFLHLTLQEFLAAYYLSKLNQDEQMLLINEYGMSTNMLNVWKFYFGLVNFETGIDRAEKIFHSVIIKDSQMVRNSLLFRIQCSYEAKQTCIVPLTSFSALSFDSTLSSYDMSAIGYAVSKAATQTTPTRCLQFMFWGPGNDKLKIVINGLNDKALEYLVRLEINLAFDVSIADLEALAEKLKLKKTRQVDAQGLKCLRYLGFRSNGIGDKGVAILAAGLDGNHVLEYLDLSGNSISATGIRELMELDCHLKHLNLSYNDIEDEGAMAVASGIRSNATLKNINLSHNKIGFAGIEAIALVLKETLLHLDLSCNKFTSLMPASPDSVTASPDSVTASPDSVTASPDSVTASPDSVTASPDSVTSDSNLSETRDFTVHDVKTSPRPPCCDLEYLDLSDNICGGDPVAIISKFTSLCHLDLSRNKLGLPKAMGIVDYVANSDNYQQIKYLGLSSRLPSNVSSFEYTYKKFLPPSGFIIDLAESNLHISAVISTLKKIKNFDRVGGVCLEGNYVRPDEFTIINLKKVFQHDQIDRVLIFNFHNLCFTVPSARTIAAESNSSDDIPSQPFPNDCYSAELFPSPNSNANSWCSLS